MAKKSMSEEADRSVIRQIDELQRMSLPALRKKWSDLFGRDPGKLTQQYLVRRLAYRIQELIYGGLSREARDQLKAWAESPEKMHKKPPREKTDLQPGTRLLRDWHGERHEVTVKEDGFHFRGKSYRSLSAVARAITGRHCGGRRFFGLQPTNGETK
jgi:Protein of unknown function (DUF2924)